MLDVDRRLIAAGSPALARLRTDRAFGGGDGLVAIALRAFHEFTFKAEYACDYGVPRIVPHGDRFQWFWSSCSCSCCSSC